MSDIIEELDSYLEPPDPEKETPATQEAPQEEAPEEETPQEEPEAEELEPVAAERDPAVQAYLDKYGGDPDKAIAAAVEAQKLIGKQGEELGELRKLIETRLPEQEEEESYVPMDDSTAQWFDTLMDENPVQAMEWARQNDPSGVYYNRGLQQWYDTNPAQAGTYQQAVIAQSLREEFKQELAEQTKPYQADHQRNTVNQAWQMAVAANPDIANHADAILQEAKDSPEIMRGANTAEAQAKALHMYYRLVKGSQASTLESATTEAETEQRQANRAAKLSGTTPQTKAVTPAAEVDDNEQFARDFLDPYLEPEAA